MRIKIEPNAISADDLEIKLKEQFPNYEFTKRGKKVIVAKQSITSGANIVVHKNRIMVGGAFPTLGGQMLFFKLY